MPRTAQKNKRFITRSAENQTVGDRRPIIEISARPLPSELVYPCVVYAGGKSSGIELYTWGHTRVQERLSSEQDGASARGVRTLRRSLRVLLDLHPAGRSGGPVSDTLRGELGTRLRKAGANVVWGG